MNRFTVESYFFLLQVELLMRFGELDAIHRLVRNRRVRDVHAGGDQITALCRNMDLACVFYPKTILCLQRSAATVLLLRFHGISAELVIGARLLPFQSHAWVEVGNVVANDKPYMSEIYQQLDRC
jgi:hypothetical protein